MPPNNETCNVDELEAPQWLNTQFVTEVLEHHLQTEELKVLNIKFNSASARGDHYASVMFRVGAEYKTAKGKSSISLIVKTMPEQDGQKKELFGESHIFQTEIAMYTQILPKFEAILREAGDEITLCAKCIYHSLKPRQVMVFEDLVTKGYEVVRRLPNTEELQAALEKLAKWHAVSHKLIKEQPELFDELKYDMTTLPNFLEQEFLTKALDSFLDMLSNVDSLKCFKKYFEPMRDNLIPRWVDVIREYRENRQDNGYYVLCHGDFHLRNMMFKGLECMLLDFQMSYVGSMANDLIYAMYMLFDADTRREKSNELIYNYLQTFLKTLERIEFQGKLPTLIELRQQLFDKRYNDFLLLTAFMPIIISMRKGSDVGELIDDYKLVNELYFQEEYVEEMKDLLPRLLHLGYFEQL